MLSNFILNGLDIFNIIYLWTIINRKNNILKLLSSVFIISILATTIQHLELHFSLIYLSSIITIKIIYKINFKKAIFEIVLVSLIMMNFQLIVNSLLSNFIDNYVIRIIVLELITLLSIIIYSKSNLNKNIRFHKVNSTISIYFILTCSIYAFVFKIAWNYNNKIILDNLPITLTLFSLLVLSQILGYTYIVKVIKEQEKLKIKNEYNAVIDEIVQEIKQRQHDFVNYKNTIRGIVEVLDEKEIKQAVINYMKDEDVNDTKINELIYIDNIIIRSIIYRNIRKAEKCHVNLKYKIENNVLDDKLNFQEISNVLNNLLNNAFDEVLKENCTRKDIEISILNQNNTSHLIIKNRIVDSTNIDLNEMFTRGYSTKNTTGLRGFGLYNVQQIVNSNKGFIKVNVECEQIVFNIYFNNSSG